MPATPPVKDEVDKLSPKPVIKKKASQPRAAGRPHKRLDTDKLDTRIADLAKKLVVLAAKTTLLQDRLDVYNKEKGLREEPVPTAG